MKKIITYFWFENQAEDAAKFYVSVFKNSKLGRTMKYDEVSSKAANMPEGSIMTVEFNIAGTDFVALNGGPIFKFTEAISFLIDCKNQKEIDYYWEKLSEGGQEVQCGWLKDKFGVSWQVFPNSAFERMLKEGSKQQISRVQSAMFEMKKIDLKELEEAFKG